MYKFYPIIAVIMGYSSQTWSPTVKLRRSIVFFPGTSVIGISTATLALFLFPALLPVKVSWIIDDQ